MTSSSGEVVCFNRWHCCANPAHNLTRSPNILNILCDLIVSRPPWNFDTSVHEDCKWVQKQVLFRAAKLLQWDSDAATKLIVR